MTSDQLKTKIRDGIYKAGSQAAFAEIAGISAQYLADYLRGRREAGPALLKYFGLEKVVTYRALRGSAK